MSIHNAEPTQAELEILQSLWFRGKATVREVNGDLNKLRPIGYTSTLKAMQLMAQKKWLGRHLDGKTHIYHSILDEEKVKDCLLNRFVDSAFRGSRSSLLVKLLGQNTSSSEELNEIKAFIEKIEGTKHE